MSKNEIKVVLVCIAKGEILYIQEFINYHLKLGFYKIIIYDNSKNNELRLFNRNNIYVIPFPGGGKQIVAYNNFIKYQKNKYDYVAFLDVDEFLVLKQHKNINDFCLDKIPNGALGINWYIFGNNGNTKYDPRPVLERFTRRSHIMDPHIKTIAKCSDLLEFHIHHPTLLVPNTAFRNIKGTVISGPLNMDRDDSVAQINHYITKSNAELVKKINRGRAPTLFKRKIEELTPFLNFNDVEDTLARDFYLSNIKCVLVCIAKEEILYIQEFIDYYLKLGFYNIFIYDNSDNNELKPFSNEKVKVLPFPGFKKQVLAYNHFLSNYKNEYDYVAFLDVDEFLVLKQHRNIRDFCLHYIPSGALAINWYFFGNNGNTKYDPRPVLDRFTKRQATMDKHVKTIAKCSDIISMEVHNPKELEKNCIFRNFFNQNSGGHDYNFTDRIAQINHYFCKSDEELKKKCDRGMNSTAEKRKYEEISYY